MKIEYHKWHSPNLGQDIELKVYGYYGKPMLVFPAQGGRFYDYENFGMVEAIHWFIETGRIKLFAVDSIDNQSWANMGIHPADRARRHENYDQYITDELVPFALEHCENAYNQLMVTGCSMGAFHAVNFFFRHPDLFDTVIALSGLYQLEMFIGDFMDETIYLNTPLAYLPNLEDNWYINQYRNSQIIVACGQGAWEDAMLSDTYRLRTILEDKGIPAWIDIWGHDVNHDWPWWHKMMPYFLGHLNLPGYTQP